MARLFKAWSVVHDFNGQDEVLFNWFVAGRKTPIAPYEELIDNYDENYDEAWCDQLLINELFTEAEIEELKGYIFNTHQIEVQVEEVPLPVPSGGLSCGLLLINGAGDFYNLADEEGYNLSVSVLGHIKEEDLSESLANKDLQNGRDFLNMVFENLDIPVVERKKLSKVLNKIYKETGFYVQKKVRK